MSIRKAIEDRPFPPDLVEVMVAAFERALVALKLSVQSDAFAELVARKVVQVTESGIRDSKDIYDVTIASFTPPQIKS